MTGAETDHFRRRLLALKKRVGGDLTELEEEILKPVGGESSGGLSDVPLHPADLGTGEFEEELTLTLVENEEQLLAEIAEAHDATPRQVALRFLVRRPSVFAIPKASNPEHAAKNAGAGDLRLTAAEFSRIDEVFPRGPRPRVLPML
jgi:aryl-alcohol dehydrogenase-like predicted oxidoreductase